MASCKITFRGIFDNPQTAQVDRSQPSALKPHIPDYNWNQLCDKIDVEIMLLQVLKQRLKVLSYVCYGLFAMVPVGFVLGFILQPPPPPINEPIPPGLDRIGWIIVTFWSAGVIGWFAMVLSGCWFRGRLCNMLMIQLSKDVLVDLNRQCNGKLTFRDVRRVLSTKKSIFPDYNYWIQVSVDGVSELVASPMRILLVRPID